MISYLLSSGDGGMADALDSGSSGSNPVRVQVPFSALTKRRENLVDQGFSLFCVHSNLITFDYLFMHIPLLFSLTDLPV